MSNYEEKFYNLLENMFIGAEIEGVGGFINLMKMKKNYYEKVFKPKLKEKVEEVLKKYEEFKNELFEKLYTFFSRYFSESGSIYFVNTPYYHQIYERIYTDKEDVILFYKTRDLYYIKTDRIFRSLDIKIEENNFYFDVSKLEYKKANEKREIIFELNEEETTKEKIYFYVYYSEKGRTTKIDEILKALKKKGIKINEEILEKAFRTFKQQSEIDYFIHKNAKAFLTEQLKLYIYNYLFKDIQEWTNERIDQINKFKEVAELIIDFVSKFEDELVKIWNKPRFVFNSNYVITLDRIAKRNGFEIIEKLKNHRNWKEQVKEWKELGIIEEEPKELIENKITGKELKKEYQFLPIDTKYFKDLELEILSLFDDLDNELDGWLIKSENYQALNTILPKFREKVQTIYIDPPFNKEQDADYFYSVKYKDATWATMLENRLRLAKEWLNEKGSIFVRCDYNGNWIVRCLIDEIFGEENFRNEIVVMRIKKQTSEEPRAFSVDYDNLYFYSKQPENKVILNPIKIPKKITEEDLWHSADTQGKYEPKVFFGKLLYPPTLRRGWFSQEKIDDLISKKELRLVCKNCGYKHYEGVLGDQGCPVCGTDSWRVEYKIKRETFSIIGNLWNDISGYTHRWSFPTENSEAPLKRVIESTSNEGDLVMDFFLGSGTTTAVAHKLKRKWIGVEMGEHFYTIVLPRMKKVLAYDKSGISKEEDVKEKYNKNNAGGFFKYYELEQFEEILRKTKYKDIEEPKTLFDKDFNYIFTTDPKMLDALELDYENNKVKLDLSKIYPEKQIDIAETISNLLGKWIKKITKDEVIFEDGEKINLNELDYKIIKPLIWWK